MYQMSGNVWEWCEDWYDEKAYERYKSGDLTLPETGAPGVLRGGSWRNSDPDYFRAPTATTPIPTIGAAAAGFVVWGMWWVVLLPRLAEVLTLRPLDLSS